MTAAVEIRNLNKWYQQYHALRDVNLTVATGESVAICGRSGSGKSTLIRCISGLEPFQVGSLRVGTIDLKPMVNDNHTRVRRVGMVFQNFNLFPHLTVLENATLGPIEVSRMRKRDAQQLAKKHLKRVQMAQFVDRYPSQLSGGQQQRVAIARSLCMNPELMLFDEPTSALDPELKKEVRDVMVGLVNDGMTMIVVTHEVELARAVASRIVMVEEGRL